MTSNWTGLYPALWTATDADGRADLPKVTDQVRFLRRAGADGVMALGSTGEFVFLDVTTRKVVLRAVAEAEPGWPLIANCSDVSPRVAMEMGRHAKQVGAHAVSLLPPWYFASNDADVVEFLVRCAEASDLPLMIYNFPERTGIRLSLETIAAVCDRVPVVALKQSGAEFAYHRDLAAVAREKRFTLITGADTRVVDAFALGARGVVSGLSNAVPELVLEVLRATERGEPAAASVAQARLGEVVRGIQGLEFPLDVAAVMQARGRATGVLKQVLSASTQARFSAAVDALRATMAPWGLGAAA